MKNFLLAFFLMITVAGFGQTRQAADSNATLNGLPVLKSYVAPDVVERAKKKYGRSLYSIEKSTAADCQNSYLVGLIRNGRLTIEWMCDDPKIALRNDTGTKKTVCRSSQAFLFAEQQIMLNGQKIFLFRQSKTVCA